MIFNNNKKPEDRDIDQIRIDRELVDHLREEALKYLNLIQIGSTVKKNIIKETEKTVTTIILSTARAIIHEKISAGLISKEQGIEILDAIFDICDRMGYTRWIDWYQKTELRSGVSYFKRCCVQWKIESVIKL